MRGLPCIEDLNKQYHLFVGGGIIYNSNIPNPDCCKYCGYHRNSHVDSHTYNYVNIAYPMHEELIREQSLCYPNNENWIIGTHLTKN